MPASRSPKTKPEVTTIDPIDPEIQQFIEPNEDAIAREDDSDEVIYQPSKYDQIVQLMEDHLREAYNLDPTGENRSIVIAVTTSQGKIFEIIADSTEDQRFKGWEVWSKIFVEAEVTKVKTAFSDKNSSANVKQGSPI